MNSEYRYALGNQPQRRIPIVSIEEVEQALKEQEEIDRINAGNKPKTPIAPIMPPITPHPSTIITPSSKYWTIEGVQYRNEVRNVQLAKELLDNGTARTQADSATYAVEAMKQKQFHTPDYPLFYNILKTVKSKTSSDSEEIRAKLKELSRANWLMTLTRIKYASAGLDEIVHMYGTPNAYSEKVAFVGTDGLIKDKSDTQVYQKLLGTGDSISEINDTFSWLNGTDTYIWRLNSRPEKLDERVAGFVASSGRAGLSCGWNPNFAIASLGVRFVAKNFGGNS